MKLENPIAFYAKYWGGTALKAFRYARVFFRTKAMLDAALKAPDQHSPKPICATKNDAQWPRISAGSCCDCASIQL